MINETGLLRTSSYTKMKYFLKGVEKDRTGLAGNLSYFRFHFKSLKTRQLITFTSRYCVCIKILSMLILSQNLIHIGPFNQRKKGKTSQKVLLMENSRETV